MPFVLMAASLMQGLERLLVCFFLLLSVFGWKNYAEASRRSILKSDLAEPISIANATYRTAYHFQPPHNWINDPNGLMYYNGIYHNFYQYNPYNSTWGNLSWGHSVSKDLIHWTCLGVALSPNNAYDANGCFSGSATIVPGKGPVIVYTGVDENWRQVQNIAYPRNVSDPFLREWYKHDDNPVVVPVGEIPAGEFRDPTTAWTGLNGVWKFTVGAKIGGTGWALVYKSTDFIHWVQSKNPLHATNVTGMWECLDFFSFQGKETKYVLKISLQDPQLDSYLLGRYDEQTDVFVPDDTTDDYRLWQQLDYGQFYAAKSFWDEGKNRRIMWGWVKECDSLADDVVKGWAGIQTAPRVLSLDTNGRQLLQWPVEEFESLRRNQTYLHDIGLDTGSRVEVTGITVSQADVEVEFEVPGLSTAEPFNASWVLDPRMVCTEKGASVNGLVGPFGLLVLASRNLEEHTAIFFRVFKSGEGYKVLMCSDQRRSSLRTEVNKQVYGAFVDIDITKDGKIPLRTLIDHSAIESYGGGGRTCITARVYPMLPFEGDAHLYAFNNGTSALKISNLNAWSVDKSPIYEDLNM